MYGSVWYVCVCVLMCHDMCRGQRTTLYSWCFSSALVWVPGIELRPPSLCWKSLSLLSHFIGPQQIIFDKNLGFFPDQLLWFETREKNALEDRDFKIGFSLSFRAQIFILHMIIPTNQTGKKQQKCLSCSPESRFLFVILICSSECWWWFMRKD